MGRSRLFVASSSESLDLADAIHENLEADLEVTVWDQGVIGPSKFVLEGLVDVLDRTDFGLFVFAPTDIALIRGEQFQAVRDNVLFELGLFIGRLGRERSFIMLPRSIKDFRLPSDLLGVIAVTYDSDRTDNLTAAVSPACTKVKKAIDKLAPHQANPRSTENNISLDENDCISIIESWLGERSSSQNTRTINFSDVDNELRLPKGSAKKLIEIAARKWGYTIARKGENTIMLQD
jgi:hypothetical protein